MSYQAHLFFALTIGFIGSLITISLYKMNKRRQAQIFIFLTLAMMAFWMYVATGYLLWGKLESEFLFLALYSNFFWGYRNYAASSFSKFYEDITYRYFINILLYVFLLSCNRLSKTSFIGCICLMVRNRNFFYCYIGLYFL